MFDRDRWHEIISAIKKNKLRSALTAFGVFWGIFMLVVMIGAGNGLKNGVYEGVKDFATNSAFVWTQSTTVPYKGFKRGRDWNFTNKDMQTLRDQVPELDVIAPRLSGWKINRGENVVRGKKAASFSINGDYPSYRKIDPCVMVYGRYINNDDISEKRKVCIIGERVYEVMFDEGEDPVGKYLRVNGVYFKVIGVFRSKNPKINIGSDKKESIYLPFTTMQHTFNYGDRVHYFAMTAKKGYPVDKVLDKVINVLKKQHKIAPSDQGAIGNFNLEKEVRTIGYVFIGINLLIWIVGIGTLIAGAVGVSNIMLVIVKERTKEIGIQRAIGARPWTIISQIITESVFLTTIAGFVGLAFGTMVLKLVSTAIEQNAGQGEDEMFFINPEIGVVVAVSAFVILIVTGVVAGLIPARKAVQIKPIEALRHE
ncbi:MAG: ABC transporter permease [Chlorobi bacterium]|nr:ABC transporter permease [Chlorobiota bacterium]